MEKFLLSTDSTCDLYQSFIAKNRIAFVPLTFMIEYKDGKMEECVDCFKRAEEYKDFYDKLRAGGYSRTAMLNYQAHYNHFSALAKAGAKDVVHFTISSGLSPTVTVADKAAADVKKDYPDFTAYNVDSLSATIGQGTLVKIALECRNEGMTAKETYDKVMAMRLNWNCCVVPNDLFYLQKGGRVSKTSAVAGSVLNIKPVITFDAEGKLKVVEKIRGMKKAFHYIAEKIESLPMAEKAYLTVVHTDNEEGANELAALLEQRFQVKPEVQIMGPVIGSHVGPGSVSCGWVSYKTRNDF